MNRTEQLSEWEKSRKVEIWIDLWGHGFRSVLGFVLFPAVWGLAEEWHWASGVKFGIAFAAGVYLTSLLIIWLRVWGAYIERRLTELEARVLNTSPEYYTSGDLESFDRSPLFERLDAIEEEVQALRRRLSSM
jgi:hypothetical protein